MRMLVILILWIASFSTPDPLSSGAYQGKQAPTVTYCDLIRNPSRYDKKEVRVKAVFRVGYEWEEIYCLDCFDTDQRTWIKFDDEVDSCTKRDISKLIGAREGTFSIVAVGEFQSSGRGYGHMGAYRYQFVVKCVEKAIRLLKDGRSPTLLPKKVLKPAC
jgi:hypothetical protein